MDFWHDVRFAARLLLKDYPFTAAAILSLALAMGLNTGIFSFLNAIFLRPFPVADPPRLVSMVSIDANDSRFLPNSFPNYQDFRDRNAVFTGMAAFQAVEVSLSGNERPERVIGQIATGNFFDVLGVKAKIGRTFLPEEDRTPGTHPVVVLSHALWQRRFAADPDIVGSSVTLNGQGFTVIGVTPKGFKGTGKRTSFQFWVPMMMHQQVLSFSEHLYDRDWRLFRVIGRRKPGVSEETAEANLKTISAQLQREYAKENRGQSVALIPFMHEALGPNDRYLFVRAGAFLAAVVGLLLLCACANVANLLLARSTLRRREISIRLSMGAGRTRLVRQLLTESVLLSLIAGSLGLLIASWSRSLLFYFKSPFFSDNALDVVLDGRVLLYALALSLLTGLIFGLAPALQMVSTSPVSVLKHPSEFNGSLRSGATLRKAIMVLQIALSFLSLVAASWFLRSLYNARQSDPGWTAESLLLVSFNLSNAGYTEEEGRKFRDRALAEVGALPGVRSVSLAENRLLAGIMMARSISTEGSTSDLPEPLTPTNSVTPGYFETLGIPIVQGRPFAPEDKLGAPEVAVVNEAMARRYWPGQDPIGKRFRFDEEDAFIKVIGVAKDSHYLSLTQVPQPHIYLSLLQRHSPIMTLYARTEGDSTTRIEAIRSKLQSLEPQLPLDPTPAAEVIRNALWAPRMAAGLLAIFGLLALVLATIGIYSIVAYTVTQRRTEIGVRMALGARRSDIFKLILRQGITIVGNGVALGLVFAVGLGIGISGLLYQVKPADPLMLGGTTLLLFAVALLANLVPARRAALLQPVEALSRS